MDAESKLISGLLCHIGNNLRGKHLCKKCPYRKDGTGKCHGNLAFDAMSYILANEYGKHLLDGLANIQEITLGKPPESISDSVMEDIRSGKGLEPIQEARIKKTVANENPLTRVKISKTTFWEGSRE